MAPSVDAFIALLTTKIPRASKTASFSALNAIFTCNSPIDPKPHEFLIKFFYSVALGMQIYELIIACTTYSLCEHNNWIWKKTCRLVLFVFFAFKISSQQNFARKMPIIRFLKCRITSQWTVRSARTLRENWNWNSG